LKENLEASQCNLGNVRSKSQYDEQREGLVIERQGSKGGPKKSKRLKKVNKVIKEVHSHQIQNMISSSHTYKIP